MLLSKIEVAQKPVLRGATQAKAGCQRTKKDEAGPYEPGFMVKFLIFWTLSDRVGR